MMDPLTVVGCAATIGKIAFAASSTLYAFVNETRNVDQTVRDLATEFKSLSNALTQVEAVLKSPTVAAA